MRIAVTVVLVAVVLVAGLAWWQVGSRPEPGAAEAVVAPPGTVATDDTAEAPPRGQDVRPAEPEAMAAPDETVVGFDAQVESMTRRDSEGLKVETLPDGSKKIDLQGHYRQAPVARLNEQGEAEVSEK